MLIWILVALIAVVSGAYVAYRRQRPMLPPGEGGPTGLLERTVRDTRVNDIIQHDGHDYLVEGVVRYDEDGHGWSSARMVDGQRVRWLLVGLERGGNQTVRVLEAAPELDIAGYPPETLDLGGTSWKLGSRGTATAAFQGDVAGIPTPPAPAEGGPQRCRWWKYQAAGERILYVEQWGEVYRALWGETVREDSVELLAAS